MQNSVVPILEVLMEFGEFRAEERSPKVASEAKPDLVCSRSHFAVADLDGVVGVAELAGTASLYPVQM
jgi:hypothetical protein